MRVAPPLWTVADCRPSNIDKKSVDGQDAVRLVNYTDVYNNQFIDSDMELMEATAPPDQIDRFRVEPGDVIITKDSETNEDIGIPTLVRSADPRMVCGYHLTLLRVDSSQLDPTYLYWWLESQAAKDFWYTNSFGVTRFSLVSTAVWRLPVRLPSLSTQRRIADYLDRETAEIDAMDAELDRLVETLRKRRSTAIRMPMQDFPLVALGYHCRVVNGSTPLRSRPDFWTETGGTPWLNSSAVNNPTVTEAPRKVTARALKECHLPNISPGDLLIGITGQGRTRGMVAMAGIKCTISQHLAAIQPWSGWDTKFLYYALGADYLKLRNDSEDGGSTKGAITCEMLAKYRAPLPPFEEQRRIVAELDEQTARIDDMIADAQRLKALLAERRSTLITEVVTGRKEVPA